MPDTTAIMPTAGQRDRGSVTEPACAAGAAEDAETAGDARLSMPRWLAGPRHVISMALVAAGYGATWAAAVAGHGHLGRVAAAQIGLATCMMICALSGSLLSPACPVIIDGLPRPGTPRRYHRLSALAFVTGCMLGLPAGGAALGAGWATTLLTTLAGACAVASIASQRLGRPATSR
jgi:hypothetical protein